MGGLVGEHQVGALSDGGLLSRVYATGRVTATAATDELTGGLVATRTNAMIEKSYWDAEATGQEVALGMESDDGLYLATKLTTDEMRGGAAETNMSEFDFEDTWFVVGDMYPQLEWAMKYRRIDRPPEAHLAANASEVDAGTPIRFNASASHDVEEWFASDPGIAEYRWWFGDGNATRGVGPNVTHSYHSGGEYEVTLAAVDSAGNIDAVTKSVSVQSTDGGSDDGDSGSEAPDLEPFVDTVAPAYTYPTGLADEIRVESTVASLTTVKVVKNTSTNYSLALTAPDGSTNVTFYLERGAINVSGDARNLTMYLDGEEHPFVVNESTGSGDSTWIGFNVPNFSTRAVRFTPEPTSSTCLAGVIAGPDGRIGLTEIQQAINYWAEDTAVPGTDGRVIGLTMVQSLINTWAEDDAVTC